MSILSNAEIAPNSIIGPYSVWPRAASKSERPSRKRVVVLTGGLAGVGVFLHCIAPMLLAA